MQSFPPKIIQSKTSEKKPFPNHSTNIPMKRTRKLNTKELVSEESINKLCQTINPEWKIDEETIEFIQEIVEQFVLESIEEIALYARHRGDNTVDFKDAKLFYERKFKRSLPSILSVFFTNQLPPEIIMKSIKKSKPPTEDYLNHIQDFKKAKK